MCWQGIHVYSDKTTPISTIEGMPISMGLFMKSRKNLEARLMTGFLFASFPTQSSKAEDPSVWVISENNANELYELVEKQSLCGDPMVSGRRQMF